MSAGQRAASFEAAMCARHASAEYAGTATNADAPQLPGARHRRIACGKERRYRLRAVSVAELTASTISTGVEHKV